MASLLALALLASAAGWPPAVEAALGEAGANRAELERVLRHYEGSGEREKLAAACFLIEHMGAHGHVAFGWFDARGDEVQFDALAHGTLQAAQRALGEHAAARGGLAPRPRDVRPDLRSVSAELLIHDVDLAFAAWRQNRWARSVRFATFCEYVLPHRVSDEPLDGWRAPLARELTALAEELGDEAGTAELAALCARFAHRAVRFDEVFYLHHTDQSYTAMRARGAGRCEDISTLTTYALRSLGIPCASDYTPYWPYRDNNHAWTVVLDATGRGSRPDGRRAAKVFRRTYSVQTDALACQLADGEQAPPALRGRTFVDVTDQYVATSDLEVDLAPAPQPQRHAYLCVFNGGAWRPIHWARVHQGSATFTRMGRDAAYLPAYWVDGRVVPAAPPFFLHADGSRETFAARGAAVDATLTSAEPRRGERAVDGSRRSFLTPGRTYVLSLWSDGWHELGRAEAGEAPLVFEGVPSGALYWLVEQGSRRLERIFTLRGGEQVWM